MSDAAHATGPRRSAMVSAALVVAAGLVAGGCSSSGGPSTLACTTKSAVALSAATGQQLWSRTLTGNDHEGIDNAPVAVDGDYVIAGAGVPLSPTQQPMIIAYRLGAHGKLPDTVGG